MFTTIDARDDAAATFLAYRALLGRRPDDEGFEHYTTASAESGELATTFNHLVHSDEFIDKMDFATTGSLVAMIYRNLFDREASDTEIDYWVNGHESDGWGHLAASIALSEEGYFHNYGRLVMYESRALGVPDDISIDTGFVPGWIDAA